MSYKVISTVMISLEVATPTIGSMSIHGSSSKQAKEDVQLGADVQDVDHFHIANIGRIIERNEDELRTTVNDNYIGKQRAITNTGRLLEEYMTQSERRHFLEMAQKGMLLGESASAQAASTDDHFK